MLEPSLDGNDNIFGTLQAKLNTRFKHLTKSLQERPPTSKTNASRVILPPLPPNPRSVPPTLVPPAPAPAPIDIPNPNQANSPTRRKRKRKPRGNKRTDANSAPTKNASDGVPATAPLQSIPQRQPRQPRNNWQKSQEPQTRASSNETRPQTEVQTSTKTDQSTTMTSTIATRQPRTQSPNPSTKNATRRPRKQNKPRAQANA